MPRALFHALLLAAVACGPPPLQGPAPRAPSPAALECPPGRGDCDGDATNGCEADLSNDLDNCHVCGHSCRSPHTTSGCFDGTCHIVRCEPGYGDCDHLAETGCEAKLCYTSHGWECPGACGSGMF